MDHDPIKIVSQEAAHELRRLLRLLVYPVIQTEFIPGIG